MLDIASSQTRHAREYAPGQGRHAVVVGGGLAGLTCAAILAGTDAHVSLFEAGQLGGRAASEHRDGFIANLGAHALYRKGAGMEVLAELGVQPRGGVPKPRILALRDRQLELLQISPDTFVGAGMLSMKDRWGLALAFARVMRARPHDVRYQSCEQWLDRNIPGSEVRHVVAALLRLSTYVAELDRLSADVGLSQLQAAVVGNVLYLDNGWQQLVDALTRVCRERGVQIHERSPVRSVDARGIELRTGERLDCDAVVVALPRAAARRVLGRDDDGVPRVRAACLELGLRRLPRPEQRFVLGLDEDLYLSVHSDAARMAPEGCVAISVVRYLRQGEKANRRVLEELVDLAQPGWRQHLVHARFLPGMVVASALPSAKSGGRAGRPGPCVPNTPGVFTAGDWVGPTGFLADTSLSSGKAAAQAAVRHMERVVCQEAS